MNKIISRGFTIVELLIVIVVIAILASITLVSYNGIRQQAAESVLKNDLQAAAASLEVTKNNGDGRYPVNGSELKASEDVTFQYTYTSADNSFCLSATSDTNDVPGYHVSSANTSIVEGVCSGHLAPGEEAPPTIPSSQVAKLLAPDGAADDLFGLSVSISGDTAVVGASGDDDAGSDSGSAYIFTRSGSSWTQQAKLTASDAAGGDYFGSSVSIDGDTAVVGASGSFVAGPYPGSVYVFTRSGSSWTQQAKLTASDAAGGDYFGSSVSIDGDTAVVGASGDDDAGYTSGSAYIFTRSGSSWTQQAKLTASDASAADWFGYSVSIGGDTAVIGAYGDNAGSAGSGSAYVFTRSGSSWTQQAKLTASDIASGDQFGRSVAINGDTAVIGSPYKDGYGSFTGSAYIFTRSGSSWTQQAKLTASDIAGYDYFGWSVSISGDSVVVGAYGNDDAGSDSGSAYIFTRSGSSWTQQAKLLAGDGTANDYFGYFVSISGSTAVIGAPYDDDTGTNSGSGYIFAP